MFAVVTIALISVAGVLASVVASPEHPIKTSLITLAVVFGSLLAITGIHLLMFVPLFTGITKLWGTNRRQGDAEHPPAN